MTMRRCWSELSEKRDRLLQSSDWTQMSDSPLTAEKKAEWAAYRAELRNLPNTLRSHSRYTSDEISNPFDGSITAWRWPAKPQ
jgi:hypothetical protein